MRVFIERRAAILDPGRDQDGTRGERQGRPSRFRSTGFAVDGLDAVRDDRSAVAFRLFSHPLQQLLARDPVRKTCVIVGQRYPFCAAVAVVDHDDAAVITGKVDRRREPCRSAPTINVS